MGLSSIKSCFTLGSSNIKDIDIKESPERSAFCKVNQSIAKELVKNGLDKNEVILSFEDERLKDPFKKLDHNGNFVPNNKDWNLVCSYNGFYAFQYGAGDYLQIYRLTPGYSDIFSKAGDKQETLRKDFSTGKITEIKD